MASGQVNVVTVAHAARKDKRQMRQHSVLFTTVSATLRCFTQRQAALGRLLLLSRPAHLAVAAMAIMLGQA